MVGTGQDSSQWATSPNMFFITGVIDYSQVFTITGKMLASLGATTYGGLG